jgi:hypothetical protein
MCRYHIVQQMLISIAHARCFFSLASCLSCLERARRTPRVWTRARAWVTPWWPSRVSQGASPSWTWRQAPSYPRLPGRFKHGRMNIKTPNPISRLWPVNEFVALCLTDFIVWRYIHSLVGIFDPACELFPPWTKELYLCTVAPLPSLWPLKVFF